MAAQEERRREVKPWMRDETILALRLYCSLPFGRMHSRTREVVELAGALGRTPNSVAMKLTNLASLDPQLQRRGIRGMRNVSRLDKDVWESMHADWEKFSLESAHLAERSGVLEQQWVQPEGETETRAQRKVRLAQGFFRSAVLSSYEYACCVCHVRIDQLLVASHIVPWSVSPKDRTNPRNGLCLCALHDRAFDRGLMTVTPAYEVRVSPRVLRSASVPLVRVAFADAHGNQIRLPSRFVPAPEFLVFHAANVFLRR